MDLETKCVEIYDKKQIDLGYILTIDEQNCIDDIIKFYMDPKVLLETKFYEQFQSISVEYVK